MTDPNQPPEWPPPADHSAWAPSGQTPPSAPVPPAAPPSAWAPLAPPPAPGFDVDTQTSDEELAPPASTSRGRKRLLASVAAIVVVVGGAAITYSAVNDAGGSGASSPRAAVQNAIDDLHKGDVIGLLDDMPSGERAAISGPLQDDISSLKRLGVLSSAADPHKVTGITFTADNLQYASDTVKVNDHVEIVKLVGGTVTADANALELPLTAHVLDLTHASSAQPATRTVDLSTVSGGVRIATVKQSGRWYVSLFYTAADSIAKHQVPTASDYLPARGASTASEAVRSAVTDLLGGKLSDALELVSPEELGAVHDYGGLITNAAQDFPDSGIAITTLDLSEKALSDGSVRVSLTKLALTTPDGKSVAVSTSGSCFSITIDGTTKKQCVSDEITSIEGLLGSLNCSGEDSSFSDDSGQTITLDPQAGDSIGDSCAPKELTSAQKAALEHLSNNGSVGVVASKSNGQWFLDPVRTITELTASVIGSLQGNDLFALISIFTDNVN